MHIGALETYLGELRAVRAVGVKETAFYPALSTLLNTVGKSLRPQVHCVMHPRGQGAGRARAYPTAACSRRTSCRVSRSTRPWSARSRRAACSK